MVDTQNLWTCKFLLLLLIFNVSQINGFDYPCIGSSSSFVETIGYIATNSESYTSNQYTNSSFKLKDSKVFLFKKNKENIGGFDLSNVPVALADIKDVLGSDIVGFSRGIYFGLCPSNQASSSVYYPYGYKETLVVKKYDHPTRCSLYHCEIGLYFFQRSTTEDNFVTALKVEQSFYIGFEKRNDGKPFLLDTFDYENIIFPLYACPYFNWIAKLSLAGFIPSDHLINDNGFVTKTNELRHIFTPIYPRKTGDKYFICGSIKQPEGLDTILVGYKINHKVDLGMNPFFDNNEINENKCGNDNLEPGNTFSYSPGGLNFEDSNALMRYMGKSIKYYSGQYLMVYDLAPLNEIESNSDWRTKYYELYEKHRRTFVPSCIKKVGDVEATLKFKYNGKILSLNEDIFENKKIEYVVIKKIERSEKPLVKCHAVPNKYVTDPRYEDFYKYRYKTILQKGRLTKNKESSSSINFFTGTQHLYEIYGFFHCVIGVSHEVPLIKTTEFVILPTSQEIVEEVIETKSIPSADTSCKIKLLDVGELIEMSVQVPGDGVTKYKGSKDKFSDKGNLRIFKKLDPLKANGTIFECIYKALGKNFLTVKRTIIFDSSEFLSHLRMRIIIIGIISSVVIIVVFILVGVTIFSYLKIKKRKRSNLLSQATSESNASSFSKSNISRIPKFRKSNTSMSSSSNLSALSSKQTLKSNIRPTSTSKSPLKLSAAPRSTLVSSTDSGSLSKDKLKSGSKIK
uniref:EGF-like domain-containing protein n=1 Tax=Parastrongyloides trichosuri TaxID=131310 RepID=A0A0N4ZKD8_PARTI